MSTDSQKTKRGEILEVACELFYEQGYHQTGIHQIIQKANTAKGTFYSHFPSKEHLGAAWLKKRHKQWMDWLLDSIKNEKDPRKRLIGVFHFIEDWMTNSDFRGCAFINTLCETPEPESPLRKSTLEHKQSLIDFLETLLSEKDPEGSSDLIRKRATSLFLLVEGTIVAMQNFRESWPVESALQQAQKIIDET